VILNILVQALCRLWQSVYEKSHMWIIKWDRIK